MNLPTENILDLKPIADLVNPPLRFRVEKYQRGYKWVKRQVEDLLGDIEAFRRRMPEAPAHSEFYSLQPVVVKRQTNAGPWELIDGQQRLTTIYLILSYLGQTRFEIDYQTRANSARFLRELTKLQITRQSIWNDLIAREPSLNNTDNYHFFEACKAIDGWFAAHPETDLGAFHRALLDRTQVIWYEVRDETAPRDIFMRLNSGKIELTPAELIKALFLRGNPSSGQEEDHKLHQAEIASEWDRMESALQDDGFWYFIHRQPGKNMPSARIEFLFDLVSARKERDDDKHAFRCFEKSAATDADAAWKEVSRRFEHLQEWYRDHTLYHHVGFLLTRGPAGVLARLLQKALHSTKREFAAHVTEQIRAKVSKEPLGKLAYDEHGEILIDVLLLFNIETLIASRSNARFPFERYKAAEWSLEHIHAQNSKTLADQQERKVWHDYHRDILREIIDQDASSAAVGLLEKLTGWYKDESKIAEKVPQELEESISKLAALREADDGDDPMHGIGNLALLERGANSSLGNAIFPIKRLRVIAMDRGGSDFVPVATKNVFLKYYTSNPSQMSRWDRADRVDYRTAILTTLKGYGVRY